MTQIDQSEFTTEVTQLAEQLYFDVLMGDSRSGLPENASESEDKSRADDALRSAEKLVSSKDIQQRLCPALLSISDDIREVSKVVSAALLPLALTPGSVIPLAPLAFAAISVVIARAGISAICKPPK